MLGAPFSCLVIAFCVVTMGLGSSACWPSCGFGESKADDDCPTGLLFALLFIVSGASKFFDIGRRQISSQGWCSRAAAP